LHHSPRNALPSGVFQSETDSQQLPAQIAKLSSRIPRKPGTDELSDSNNQISGVDRFRNQREIVSLHPGSGQQISGFSLSGK
jgi:hypothetical protein